MFDMGTIHLVAIVGIILLEPYHLVKPLQLMKSI